MLVTAKSSGITVMRYFVTRYSQHCTGVGKVIEFSTTFDQKLVCVQ